MTVTSDSAKWKNIGGILFRLILVAGAVFLWEWNRRQVPARFFIIYAALTAGLILLQIATHRYLASRYGKQATVIRVVGMVEAILMGCLIFFFALYVYPGK